MMDSVARGFDPDPQKSTPKPPSFPNGTLKKHLPRPSAPAAEDHHHYRECLRNHAASLGGHAVDGCCEFMPSPSADPAIPASITCAACGCHRNFHRRLPLDPRLRHDDTDVDDDEEESENDDGEHRLRRRRSSASPPPYSSAPHMLLSLSGAGTGTGRPGPTQTLAAPITVSSGAFQAVALPHEAAAGTMPRKRFRTKFSAEQKERMQEMSERLGWRLQKKDEAVVEEFCRQAGVERGVFKVWMHNNKHTYNGSPSSRRREMGGSGGDVGGSGGGGEGNGLGGGGVGGDDDDNDRRGNNDVVNNCPSSP